MIVPFLKKNEKHSLYSKDLDLNLDGELSFLCEDKTNYSPRWCELVALTNTIHGTSKMLASA